MTTTNEQAREVAAHMGGLHGTVADPRLVGFEGGVRAACWFSQLRELPQGSPARRDAVQEGRSPTYVHEGLYVLGDVPVVYEAAQGRGESIVFVDEANGEEWFVAGYVKQAAAILKAEFHPFGVWFMLKRAVDEDADARRVPIRVTSW